MQLTLREATHSDLETLYAFEQGLIAAERPFDTTLGDDPLHYYDLPQMIDSEDVYLVVAEIEGVAVGCGYARKETAKHYLKHKYHAYLGFMFVQPAYRGKGINKVIMHRLLSWAKEKGLTEARLDVYHRNDPAIKAYEKAGFVQHMIQMRRGID